MLESQRCSLLFMARGSDESSWRIGLSPPGGRAYLRCTGRVPKSTLRLQPLLSSGHKDWLSRITARQKKNKKKKEVTTGPTLSVWALVFPCKYRLLISTLETQAANPVQPTWSGKTLQRDKILAPRGHSCEDMRRTQVSRSLKRSKSKVLYRHGQPVKTSDLEGTSRPGMRIADTAGVQR